MFSPGSSTKIKINVAPFKAESKEVTSNGIVDCEVQLFNVFWYVSTIESNDTFLEKKKKADSEGQDAMNEAMTGMAIS